MEQIPKDLLWKGIIEDLADDFIAFFFPDIIDSINSSKPFGFLDKELNKLYPEGDVQNRRADKLIRVPLKNGADKWILVHVEVQGYDDPDFEKRMFQMCFRIFDRYNKMPYPLVIYTNTNPKFQKDLYAFKNGAMELIYHFKTFILQEYKPEELIRSSNPFAIVLETARNGLGQKVISDELLLSLKIDLARRLFKNNYSRQKVEYVLNFIKRYVSFESEKYLDKFENKIFKPNQPMGIKEAILTYTEEKGIKKGIEQGIEKGIERGIERGIYTAIQNMYERNVSITDMASFLGVSVDKVKEVLENLNLVVKEQ